MKNQYFSDEELFELYPELDEFEMFDDKLKVETLESEIKRNSRDYIRWVQQSLREGKLTDTQCKQVIEPYSEKSTEMRRIGGEKSKGLLPTKSDASLVHQQNLGNCPLPAVLSALVHVCPKQISHIIQEVRGKPVSTVVTKDRTGNLILNGPPKKVKPHRLFRIQFSDGDEKCVSDLLYFRNGQLLYGFSMDRTEWVPLIEKAYLLHRIGWAYEMMEDNVDVDVVMLDLVGPCLKLDLFKSEFFNISFNDEEDINEEDKKKLNDGQLCKVLKDAPKLATIATSKNRPKKAMRHHTYTVLMVTKSKEGKCLIHLREATRDSILTLTVKQFKADFDLVIQALAHMVCKGGDSCEQPRLNLTESELEHDRSCTIASTPTPDRFYKIKIGDTLFGIAAKAYSKEICKGAVTCARKINDAPYNKRFWTSAPASERKWFPNGRISFNPSFTKDVRAQASAKGKSPRGHSFATIYIQPL
jgi:hypothetical protein